MYVWTQHFQRREVNGNPPLHQHGKPPSSASPEFTISRVCANSSRKSNQPPHSSSPIYTGLPDVVEIVVLPNAFEYRHAGQLYEIAKHRHTRKHYNITTATTGITPQSESERYCSESFGLKSSLQMLRRGRSSKPLATRDIPFMRGREI